MPVVDTHSFFGDFVCSEPALRAISRKYQGKPLVVKTDFPLFLDSLPYQVKAVPRHSQEHGKVQYSLINDHGGNANLVTSVAQKYKLELSSELPDFNIPWTENLYGEYYAVCAEASTKDRQWDENKWAQLVKELDKPVIQLGYFGKCKIPGADQSFLGRKLPPSELAALIRHAKTFITVDTGLSHFAAAVQKPYIVLMDKVPVAWRLHKGYTHAIHKNGIHKITVEEVTQAIQEHDQHIRQKDKECG